MSTNILLVGSTDRRLEEVLRACGMRTPGLAGAELGTLAQPSAKQPDVLVLDVRDQNHLPATLPALKRQHPATGVIIVTSRMEPGLLLQAMRAGVTEVVSNLTEDELRAAINRLMAARAVVATPLHEGRTYAFVGAKGGVGTTTVAVNVATALARLDPHSTILIDLHVTNGDAAVFLGVEPRFSIMDAVENIHRLDESFFKTLVVRAKCGVDLLASSDRMMAGPVDVRRIRTILEFAAQRYRHVVLDVPRSDAALLDSLEAAAQIVVVANQELATVRSASRIASALRQRYGKEKVMAVVSRSDRHADIGQEDVERAVGAPVTATFPSDYRRALHALNKGVPVTVDNHNDLSGAFVRFAKTLSGIERKDMKERSTARFGIFGSRKGNLQETR